MKTLLSTLSLILFTTVNLLSQEMSVETTKKIMNQYLDSEHSDVSLLADDVVFTHMATGDEHHGTHIGEFTAQWGNDIRLTNNPASSILSFNNAQCIASSGEFVHIVWQENRDGNEEIYYKRSTDGGSVWEEDVRLTNNGFASLAPAIGCWGENVHITWFDNRTGVNEIFYKKSTDAGIIWTEDTRLTQNTAPKGFPSIFVLENSVHIAWGDNRNGGMREVYYKNSTDGGNQWSEDIRLTDDPNDARRVSVSATGTFVHVSWIDNRDGNYEVYYKQSQDRGITWASDMRMTSNVLNSEFPTLVSSGTGVHLFWIEGIHLYYRHSTDNGSNWADELQLETTTISVPSAAVAGSNIYLVWADSRNGNPEIYYRKSYDGGASWEPSVRLTENTASSTKPFIKISGTTIHLIWQDNRDGNEEIYYKQDPIGNPVDVREPEFIQPVAFALFQNYPNPFNPSTNIHFALPQSGFVTLEIFSVTGERVDVLISEELNAGKYNYTWNGSNLTSGIYFYRLQTGSFVETRKMLLLK